MLISPRWISGISRADTEVSTDLGSIETKEAPAWDPDTSINREYEIKLYGFPRTGSTSGKSVKESSS